MKPLHPKTLEALAALICGDNGPVYRGRVDLTAFLQRADPCFPDHDGVTGRKAWTMRQLRACNDEDPDADGLDRSSLAAVLVRLADPREYGGDPDQIGRVLTDLNRILVPEGLAVKVVGAVPHLHAVTSQVVSTDASAVPYLCPDFQQVTDDARLVASLAARWEEARRCMGVGAHLATVLLLGSILEGVLMDVINRHQEEANRSPRSPKAGGKVKPFRDWSLHDCIEVACERRWLRGDRLRFSHALRESRNLVHPDVELASGEWPTESSCRICWEVVKAALDDLQQHRVRANQT